ncbi:hypothetical protein V6Z12_D05G120800 [Gossypium hirsutum]
MSNNNCMSNPLPEEKALEKWHCHLCYSDSNASVGYEYRLASNSSRIWRRIR